MSIRKVKSFNTRLIFLFEPMCLDFNRNDIHQNDTQKNDAKQGDTQLNDI
jgi:hypothetical protein